MSHQQDLNNMTFDSKQIRTHMFITETENRCKSRNEVNLKRLILQSRNSKTAQLGRESKFRNKILKSSLNA